MYVERHTNDDCQPVGSAAATETTYSAIDDVYDEIDMTPASPGTGWWRGLAVTRWFRST